MEEQVKERGRDHSSLRDAIPQAWRNDLSRFGLGAVILNMCLSAGQEVGDPFLIVGVEVGCEDFGYQDWDGDSVKSL